MPRYKTDIWGDSGYDAVGHLIDSDPCELARLFRRSLSVLQRLVDAIETEGTRVGSVVADPYVAARSIVREWYEATDYEEPDDY